MAQPEGNAARGLLTSQLPYVNPPPSLKLTDKSRDEWKIFKQQYEIFEKIVDLDKKDASYQCAMFLNTVGPKGLAIYNSFDLTEDEKDNLKLIKEKFETYIIGETNETYERFTFNKRDQNEGESIDSYVSVLRDLSQTCNFCECLRETLLRDRIVLGIKDSSTRKVLLQKRKLTLKDTIDICRSAEATQERLKMLNASFTEEENVHRVKARAYKKEPKSLWPKYKKSHYEDKLLMCKFCAQKHVMKKENCPAWGKTCNTCKKKNHFAVRCPEKTRIHGIETDDSDSDHFSEYSHVVHLSENINALNNSLCGRAGKDIHAEMIINEKPVIFQIDCGSTVNLISESVIKDTEIKPTVKSLIMWNKSEIKPVGTCKLKLKNPKTGEKCWTTFYVVKAKLRPLLGKKICERMGLITVNYNKFCVAAVESPDVIQKAEDQYDDVFEDKIGTLPGDPVRLHCEENCIPKIMPARREPVALREKVKVKLEEMCLAGVLAKVDKPTDWVSQMVVTEKKSGDLRICLDPRPLNDVLKREQYTLPTLEDTLTQLSNAKVFTKLDLSNGYWHVPMEEESSYLTTFITDHGRFRWLRLPFGLSVSSEIFQKRLHQAIDGLPGVICVADDIVVYGSGGNKDTATKDHDVKLAAVLERC